MKPIKTNTPLTGAEICVLSFFDGMIPAHIRLLQRATKTAGGKKDHVGVVVVCNEENPDGSILLTLQERVNMLREMGFPHIETWLLPPEHKAIKDPALPLAVNAIPCMLGDDLLENPFFKRMRHSLKEAINPTDETDKQPSLANAINASKIQLKEMICQGEVEEALHFSGYAYPLYGRVVTGNMIGRTLGYPTANLRVDNAGKVLPAQGVYTALVLVEGKWFQSMVNIGIRPTLDMDNVTIEAHLFGFQENIYGKTIGIHFLSRVRDEMRFASLADLKHQLDQDRRNAQQKLADFLPHLKTTDFVKWS